MFWCTCARWSVALKMELHTGQMLSKLRIGAPQPQNASVSLSLSSWGQPSVAEVTLGPIQGGRSSFFTFAGGERCESRGLCLKMAVLKPIAPHVHVVSQLSGLT